MFAALEVWFQGRQRHANEKQTIGTSIVYYRTIAS